MSIHSLLGPLHPLLSLPLPYPLLYHYHLQNPHFYCAAPCSHAVGLYHLSPCLSFCSYDFHKIHAQYMLGGLVTYVTFALVEQPVHASGNILVDCLLYSEKQQKHSINILGLIALNGTILWLSS